MDSAWEESKQLEVVQSPCIATAGIILVHSKGDLLAYLL